MNRRLLPLALSMAMAAGAASAQDAPSVLVQVATLHKGSLPRLVTAYGSVEAGPSARQTMIAPLSAVVDQVYVRQGQTVAKGAPLVRLLPSPPVAASYAQAEAALRAATLDVERTGKLLGQHLATAQQLAAAQKSKTDAAAGLAALRAQGAGGANVLEAPFDAVVTSVSTRAGALAGEGAALLDLAQPEGLVLKVGVMPARASAINAGDDVRIRPLGGASFAGKVQSRGSVVEPGTGLVPVDIALAPGQVIAGQRAEAIITTGEVEGYVVPHEAILLDDRGKPYVVQAVNGTARKIPVEILDSVDDQDVIAGELIPSADLVLAGNYQLQDGMKLRVADPAEAKP
jgi:membrane fusion protein (multidrug efflux system)